MAKKSVLLGYAGAAAAIAILSLLATEIPQKNTPQTATLQNPIAFFYQNVGQMTNGSGKNAVMLGTSEDGTTITSTAFTALAWNVGTNAQESFGDPVWSHLAAGNWAMTATTLSTSPNTPSNLLYFESSCPEFKKAQAITLKASSASGCIASSSTGSGKSSQIFSVNGANYLFHMIEGDIYLTKLSDENHATDELDALCILKNTPTKVSDLRAGDSMKILSKESVPDLHLSDTAIAQRADGTWTLFVKGIESDTSCAPNTVCELCARSIYRTTSTDLVNWSSLEKVVAHASVPDAQTINDTVWLYYQDFSAVCEADNQKLAARAPMSARYEINNEGDLSEATTLTFPDESFETNEEVHYATNANPVTLNAKDMQALESCIQ